MIANAHARGRDKLTFVIPPQLASIGLWLEQLIAESTGKAGHGRAADRGRAARPRESYGADRLFVHLRHGPHDPNDPAMNTLRAAGHPVFTQQFDGAADLGALFVEWEIATALVGAKLHINPFDQPNVQEAKDRTVAILEGFARDGKLPVEEAGSIAETLAHAEEGRSYVCLQAFVAPTAERAGQARAAADPYPRRARLRRQRRLRAALPALDRPVPQGRAAERRVRAAAGGRAGRRDDPRARVRVPYAARCAGAG